MEVVAALRQIGRLQGEAPAYINTLINSFNHHLVLSRRKDPVYRAVQLTDSLIAVAAAMCNKYADISPGPLRSLDAIQLASAQVAIAAARNDLILVTSDTLLAAFAAFKGLRVINPAYPPVSPMIDTTESS